MEEFIHNLKKKFNDVENKAYELKGRAKQRKKDQDMLDDTDQMNF
ncbi:MAG: hypothetical protein JWS12_795 [Candidatus Saccharibacteria bacterium]|nr:hypothetical protein [Candidatus Saccharibacteria bacterium]